ACFFFHDTPAPETCTLSLHDALPIFGDGVRVAVDGELDPGVAGRADVVGGQIEPLRRGVDLERGAGARAGPEQLAEVDLDRRARSEEHTSELQSRENLVCRLLLEKKK